MNDKFENILYVDTSKIIVGSNGEKQCLYLDKTLNEGSSNKTECFNNPSLSGTPDGNFKISDIEIYILE